jgi:hypothetical protein
MAGLSRPGLTASFVGDYAGRHSSKTINATHTSLLNYGEDLVSEITNGTAVNTLQSPLTDQPIARGGLYLTPNHLGSTTTLTDSNGNPAEQYFYLPFGQTWQSAATQSRLQVGDAGFQVGGLGPNGGRDCPRAFSMLTVLASPALNDGLAKAMFATELVMLFSPASNWRTTCSLNSGSKTHFAIGVPPARGGLLIPSFSYSTRAVSITPIGVSF